MHRRADGGIGQQWREGGGGGVTAQWGAIVGGEVNSGGVLNL